MAPPKKTVKMDLSSFLNDDTFTSNWNEDDVDVNKIRVPIENSNANTIPLEELAKTRNNGAGVSGGFGGRGGFGGQGGFGGNRGGHLDPALGGGDSGMGMGMGRRAREEYPVPNEPPYRAIINNIPWDISPGGVKAWVEDGLAKPDAVEEVDLPMSPQDPTRLKGMAFITLKEREDLVTALTFNATKLNERTVYVSVAAPRRGGFGGSDNFDWGSARGSAFQSAGPGREEVDIDWSGARGSNFRAPRERREEPNIDWDGARGANFRAPREPREEPNLDWDSARGSNFRGQRPPREPREEVNLDWDSARGSHFKAQRPPREPREEPNLDWNAARGSNFKEQRAPRERKQEPSLDWGAARGSKFQDIGKRGQNNRRQTKEEAPVENKIQKSAFDVLRGDDDDEEDNETAAPAAKAADATEEVAEATQKVADLSVEDNDEWETVGKK